MSALPPDVGLLEFARLFPEFEAPSWAAWRAVLARLVPGVSEFYAIAGRGSGKSRVVALIACWFACREYARAPGEDIFVGVFAPDRKQARVTFRYIVALLRSVPALAALIVNETKESVELSHGVTAEVITATVAAPRSRSYACAVVEEGAFLPADDSANPDVELVRALRPALGRVRASLLAVVSSPYARRGVVWQAARKYAGHEDTPGVVFVQADTATLNPTFDRDAIARAYEDDPVAAATEFGAQFRSDIEGYVSQEAADAVVVPGRFELPHLDNVGYFGGLDFAGGGKGAGGDSATLAIAHAEVRDGRAVAVLDLVREQKPPFSPESVCASFAETLLAYGITTATADRWAGQFPVERMRKHGVSMEPSPKPKSDVYRELLPAVNSGGVELLDHPRLLAQLVGLERRTARGGKDSIDHAPGSHDDVINSAAIALVLAAASASAPTFEDMEVGLVAKTGGRLTYGPGPELPPALGGAGFDMGGGILVDEPEDDEDGPLVRDDLTFSQRGRHRYGR